MNEGLAGGVGDFNVFSALNGDANFQDLSSEVDDDATELNLVEAVASGEKIDTSFTGENEAETTEEYLDDERRSEICQNVVSAACASCAAAGTCPILRMRNFAEENLQKATEEPESYLSALMDDGCGVVVAGYVSVDDEEKPSEPFEKNSPSEENEKVESVPEKPSVKSETGDDNTSARVSVENNEVNKSPNNERLDDKSVLLEDAPSARIIKENIPPKTNEELDEVGMIAQIKEDVDKKIDIHKEDTPFEDQTSVVDKENELSIKKDSYIENDNNNAEMKVSDFAPILKDSAIEKDLDEEATSNESNSLPVHDFVQVNNEIDVAMDDDNNNAPVEIELSDEVVCERIESVELIENKKDSPILPQRDFEECKAHSEDSENVVATENSNRCSVISEEGNAVDDLSDCAELSEEVTRELEELPTNRPEVIRQFIPDLKLADDEIGQNNIVDKVVKKVAKKTELTEECSGLVTADDCDEVKCSVKIVEPSDYCDDINDIDLSKDLNFPVFQEISTSPDNSSEEKDNYNCDGDGANNTNMSGAYSGLWADDSPLNPEDDKTSNVSYNSSVLYQLIALVGSLAVRVVLKKQEGLCK